MVGIDNDDEFGPEPAKNELIVDGTILPAKVNMGQIDTQPIKAAELKTYPYDEGDNLVLGPGVIATKDRSVINWDGVNYVPQKAFEAHPPLKSYKVGEYVQVLLSGDWRDGKVMGSERNSTMLHVETEVGPISVMAPLRIRKVAS